MTVEVLPYVPLGAVRVVSARFNRVLGFLMTECTPFQAVRFLVDDQIKTQPAADAKVQMETLEWVKLRASDGEVVFCLRANAGSHIWRCPSFLPL